MNKTPFYRWYKDKYEYKNKYKIKNKDLIQRNKNKIGEKIKIANSIFPQEPCRPLEEMTPILQCPHWSDGCLDPPFRGVLAPVSYPKTSKREGKKITNRKNCQPSVIYHPSCVCQSIEKMW